jgi:hypothetical protein
MPPRTASTPPPAMRAMLVQKRPRLRVLWSACNRLLGGQAAYKVARHATRNENFVKSGDASGILRGPRGDLTVEPAKGLRLPSR